ncbi:hypothetical protein SDC9_126344 [bioreactor metagenome]|uniref:Uncharacterized protein n=1 Tax=bioreactor metagenome TaxID=1076179 RepID=A0A645CQW3_9ZZZZ
MDGVLFPQVGGRSTKFIDRSLSRKEIQFQKVNGGKAAVFLSPQGQGRIQSDEGIGRLYAGPQKAFQQADRPAALLACLLAASHTIAEKEEKSAVFPTEPGSGVPAHHLVLFSFRGQARDCHERLGLDENQTATLLLRRKQGNTKQRGYLFLFLFVPEGRQIRQLYPDMPVFIVEDGDLAFQTQHGHVLAKLPLP